MLKPRMFAAEWVRRTVICALGAGLLLFLASLLFAARPLEQGRGLLPAVGVKLAQVVTCLPRDGGRTRLIRAW